jgi:hypothetical protein
MDDYDFKNSPGELNLRVQTRDDLSMKMRSNENLNSMDEASALNIDPRNTADFHNLEIDLEKAA